SRLKSLFRCWFFKVEGLELNLREGCQLLHSAGEERGGNITESIGVQAALEQREQQRRQPTGSSANFEDAQSASLGQMTGQFLNGPGDGPQPLTGEKPVAVEVIQQVRSGARKEDLNCFLFAPQHRSQFGTSGRAEQRLGEVARII